VLSDAEKRKQYDQMRRLGAFDGGPRRSSGGPRPAGAPGDVGAEGFDFGDFGGLGDIFSSIFGRGGRQAEPRGESLEAVVEVPFRVAALGGKITVTIPVTEPCPTCSGSGGAPGATWSTCPECNGRGTISFGQGGFAVNRPSQPCPTCRGAGDVRTERRVAITVPPATETGSRIRLRGQGESSRPGGTPGDLIITFQVQPDRFFRREGLDIVCEVPLNVAQAVLGTRLRVRTLDGKKVMLRIPPGTQPGRKFRIKGQGLEKNGRKGDQLVGVQISVPNELTPEQQDLMKKFAESAGMTY
jgi:molecular chaperone DnaJ